MLVLAVLSKETKCCALCLLVYNCLSSSTEKPVAFILLLVLYYYDCIIPFASCREFASMCILSKS